MVLMSSHALLLVFTVVIVWLIGVSFLVLRVLSHFNRLTKGVTNKTFSEILKEQLEQDKQTKLELKKVLAESSKLREESSFFLQKIGIIRFNPFSDIGGDQSFSMALLDRANNGIVMTALYARTGMRWYVKTVKNGKGVEHELTSEEKDALKKAKD